MYFLLLLTLVLHGILSTQPDLGCRHVAFTGTEQGAHTIFFHASALREKHEHKATGGFGGKVSICLGMQVVAVEDFFALAVAVSELN